MTSAEGKDLDLQALLAVADAATPGEWVLSDDIFTVWEAASLNSEGEVGEFSRPIADCAWEEPERGKANAAFIAAFSPSVARELIERVEKAEAQLTTMGDMLAELTRRADTQVAYIGKLEAALRIAQKPVSLERLKP